MSDAFDRFLEARASHDQRLLDGIVLSCNMHSKCRETTHAALACTLNKRLDHFFIDQKSLRLATRFGVQLAGESAKILARERPDLVEKYPDFPWIPLKRIRDLTTHAMRENAAGRLDTTHEAIAREEAKLIAYYARTAADESKLADHDSMIAQPEMAALRNGLKYYFVLSELAKNVDEAGHVYLSGEAGIAAAKSIGMQPYMLPMYVTLGIQHGLLNSVADLTQQVSPFFGELKNAPTNHPRVDRIIGIRNKWAHFTHMQNKAATQEAGVDRLKLFDELEHYSASVQNQLSKLGSNPAQVVETLASTYQQRLGKSVQVPENRELINRSVSWVTSVSKENMTLENAYVYAVIKLVRIAPHAQAAKLLDFVEAQNGTIRNLDNLAAKFENCPPELNHMARQFLADIKAQMPKKEFNGVA